jgi:hypothetical protein
MVGDCSGPCPSTPHRWTQAEIARDMQSLVFPAKVSPRDRLYHTRCRITRDGTIAICTGVRLKGDHPKRPIVVRGLLRANGSWGLICWPNPPSLCDAVQIREQRAHPMTA